MKFNQAYPSKENPERTYSSLYREFASAIINNSADRIPLIDELNENEHFKEFIESIDKIKNESFKKQKMAKYIACYLQFEKKRTSQSIVNILPLTINQIKRTFQDYQSGKLKHKFEEKRNQHMKEAKIMGPEKLEWLKTWFENRENLFVIFELLQKIRAKFPGKFFSQSTIYLTIKYDLQFEYKILKKMKQQKNEIKNKIYRYWFMHLIMERFSERRIVKSVDESSLSSYNSDFKGWTNETLMKNSSKEFTTGVPNLSLLFASSQNQIIRYYIVAVAIDSVIFVDFLMSIEKFIEEKTGEKPTKVLYIMDNASIHINAILYEYYTEKKIDVLLTPKYSPEVNFIEHILNEIKKKYRKKEKSAKKVR